jgi:hypothetical protein
MAHLEALGQGDRAKVVAVKPRAGSEGALALLLVVVVALAALGEVVASRVVRMSPITASSSWEAVLQIGDDARARGDVQAARRAYLTALFRARGEHSHLGVLRAAEGFRELGDREVVAQALRIAATLGPERDAGPDVIRRLRALRDEVETAAALPIPVQALP